MTHFSDTCTGLHMHWPRRHVWKYNGIIAWQHFRPCLLMSVANTCLKTSWYCMILGHLMLVPNLPLIMTQPTRVELWLSQHIDLALWSWPNSSIAISVYFARLPVEPLAEGYPLLDKHLAPAPRHLTAGEEKIQGCLATKTGARHLVDL